MVSPTERKAQPEVIKIEKYTKTATLAHRNGLQAGRTASTAWRVIENGQVIADGIATKREATEIAFG
jgi:hypothetical protein